MKFKYVRIQGKELAINTKYAKGIFSMFQKLIRDGVMEQEDADLGSRRCCHIRPSA